MRTSRPVYGAALVAALSLAAPLAHADAVWPELLAERTFVSPIPIAIGLMVEVFFLEYGLKIPVKRAIVVSIVMNAASTAAGVAAYLPVTWAVKAYGIFSPFTTVGLFLLAITASTAIELAVVRRVFHAGEGRRGLGVLLAANIVSTVIAFYYMLQTYFPK